MSREITPEHAARMREGRERQLAEDRELKAAREAAYSEWVRKDSRLYRAVLSARDEGDQHGETVARGHWLANQRKMPELP